MNDFERLLEAKRALESAKNSAKEDLDKLIAEVNDRIEIIKLFGDIKRDDDPDFTFEKFVLYDDGSVVFVDKCC